MKFVSFKTNNQNSYGILSENENSIWNLSSINDRIYSGKLLPKTLLEGIEEGEQFLENVRTCLNDLPDQNEEHVLAISEIEFLAPIPKPRKNIMCVGKNYREHAIEMGSEADIPEHIMIFTKAPTSVIGHQDQINSHETLTNQLDYEGELAIIMGRNGYQIDEQDALDYIFGYTILNDVTARDLQKKHKQFFIGKSLDTFCPIGPYIVTKEMVSNPQQLNIETKVNGEVRQSSDTSQMIFSIPTIISTLSQGMTLEAGDIIATGTPAGVGKGFNPPRFLKSGDEIEIVVEQVGILKNLVR